MNDMQKNNVQRTDLIEKLMEYIKNIDFNQPFEVKPDEYLYIDKIEDEPIQVIQKENSTKVEKQIQILSDNIVNKFFELNDEKFQAVLKRINFWRILVNIRIVYIELLFNNKKR